MRKNLKAWIVNVLILKKTQWGKTKEKGMR